MTSPSTTDAGEETFSLADLDCPEYGASGENLVERVNFWVEGVLQTTIAAPGLVGI